MLQFKYRPIANLRQFSKTTRKYSDIKFIVIHDTANTSIGANAMAHYRYLQHAQRYGSAQYYVDDKEVVQVIGDSRIAWSVGDRWANKNRTRADVTNANSLNVEICINKDGDYAKAVYNAAELVKNLMIKFNRPADCVVRHFDASGKTCPRSMSANNWQKWWEFKAAIQKPRELIIDLDRDSVAKRVDESPEVKESKESKESKETKETKETKERKNRTMPITRFKSQNGLDMIITKPVNIYQQFIGNNLRAVGAYGINGTFYDTRGTLTANSICNICINNGKPISENGKFNCKYGVKKGTFIIDYDNKVHVERLANIDQFTKSKVKFAVGGMTLLPETMYDAKAESIAADVLRYAWHTAIGYNTDTDEVYLITTNERCGMHDFAQKIKSVGCTHAVALDGGGSTQMFYKGRGIHSARRVCTIVGVCRYSSGRIGNEE